MAGPLWSRQDPELDREDEVGRTMSPRQEGGGRGRGKKLGLMLDPGQEGCGRGRGRRVTVSRRWDPGRGRGCAGWRGRVKDGWRHCVRKERWRGRRGGTKHGDWHRCRVRRHCC